MGRFWASLYTGTTTEISVRSTSGGELWWAGWRCRDLAAARSLPGSSILAIEILHQRECEPAKPVRLIRKVDSAFPVRRRGWEGAVKPCLWGELQLSRESPAIIPHRQPSWPANIPRSQVVTYGLHGYLR